MAGSRTSTLSAIAGEAGVSVSAVSKVLNGGTDVAADTRARIARLLRQHGYQVASQTGFAVADLLIGCLDSPWAEELTRGAVEAAAEADVSVIVTMVTSSAGFARWLDLASRRGTGGALCVLQLPGSQELQRLAAARFRWYHRPAGRNRRRDPVGRHHELAGRRAGNPSPDRSRASADRSYRPGGGVVGPGPASRVPCGHAGAGWVSMSAGCRDEFTAAGGRAQARWLLALADAPTCEAR